MRANAPHYLRTQSCTLNVTAFDILRMPLLRMYYTGLVNNSLKIASRLRNRNAHRFIIVEGGLNRRRERSDMIIVAERTAVARTLRVMATRAVHEVHFLEVAREYSGI